MSADLSITITNDTATPFLHSLTDGSDDAAKKRSVGLAITQLTQDWVRNLGTNKRGWPTTNFYAKAASNAAFVETADGVMMSIDHPDKPGAMRQRYHGGTINMKDKLLTIPARAEAYGRTATSFDNLRFVRFNSGAMALVIGQGGTGLVNFSTGRSRSVRGAGVRAAGLVMFWLKESVDQQPDETVLPPDEAYVEAAQEALAEFYENKKNQ